MATAQIARPLIAVVSAALVAAACPPTSIRPGIADATPPAFATIVVGLEPSASQGVREEFDLNGPNDVIRTDIGTDLAFRIALVAGDPDTGITNVSVLSELRWRCRLQLGSEIIGIFQRAPIAFQTIQQPSSATQPFGVNVRADPIAQTGCDRSAGKGVVDVSGFVRVVITNGASPASTQTSKTFIFDYQNAIGPATGISLSSGRSPVSPYIAECRAQDVPIPPDWSIRSTAWIAHGDLNDDNGNMLQPGRSAFVWTYTHPRLRGACIALPRSNGGSRGGLAGIICQSATTGRACFWDSRNRIDANPGASTPALDWSAQTLRIADLKDAMTLTANDLLESGVCTECHHGENVFLVSPSHPVWTRVLKTADLGPNFTTRVEGSPDTQGGLPRYVPVSGVGGAVRPGWDNTFRAGMCSASCHEEPTLFPNPPATPTMMPPPCGPTVATVQDCYR